MIQIILTGTTYQIDDVYRHVPYTITLNSSAGGRKIEVSTNNGTEFFQPVVDITTATMLVVSINSPTTNIKVTGAIGDILTVVN